jgi:hypothetical protein
MWEFFIFFKKRGFMLISQYALINSKNNFKKKKSNDTVKSFLSSSRAASDTMDTFNKRTPKFGMEQLLKASRLLKACKADPAYSELDEKCRQIQVRLNQVKGDIVTFLKYAPRLALHSDIANTLQEATLDNENAFEAYSSFIQSEPNFATESPVLANNLQRLNNEGNQLRRSLEESKQKLERRETEIRNSL